MKDVQEKEHGEIVFSEVRIVSDMPLLAEDEKMNHFFSPCTDFLG